MNEHPVAPTEGGDTDLRALATIDPAGAPDRHAHRSVEAQELLASIASERAAQESTTRRRWPWVAAAAAVTAGVIVIGPMAGGRDGAYASWTDVPAAASAADARAAEDECRQMWLEAAEPPADGMPAPSVIEQADLVLAEQRGDFTYTVLADGDWAMDCLVQTRTGFGWGGGGGGAGGSLQPLGDSGPLPADGIADLNVGGFGGDGVDGWVLMLYARVGEQVSAVVVHTPGAGDVEATVTNGYVAAWAPGLPDDAFDEPSIGLTLHLADGTEIEMTPEEVEAAALVVGADAG